MGSLDNRRAGKIGARLCLKFWDVTIASLSWLRTPFDNSTEAIQWARRYVDYDNAGGWERIIVNDARGEAGETVWSWEITDDDA